MKKRIYTDTSVIGGCFDEEFSKGSIALFESFRSGASVIVLSNLTLAELESAPTAVQEVIKTVSSEFIDYIEFSQDASDLADVYLQEGVVTKKSRIDAQHIATATVHRVDVLVSWNFKHIVNLERIHGYNSVNLRLGYPLLEIRTPVEVIPYED